MNLEIDYNPTPAKAFFISVSLNKTEAISFDYTIKGHRVIKQLLIDRQPFPENKQLSGEWDTLVFRDTKFIKKYPVKWIDLDKKDWCNDEIWETISEKPISSELKDKLLKYSREISDNYENPEISKKLQELENLLRDEIKNFKVS